MYFSKINETDFAGIEEVIDDFDFNASIEVYDLKGVKVADNADNLPTGLYIVRQGNLSKKSGSEINFSFPHGGM